MALSIGLTQETSLKLSITPEMHQSIHILQLSNYDLTQYLYDQASENPLLEIKEYSDSIRSKSSNQLNSKIRSGSESDPLWKARTREQTLEEYLLSQLRMADLPPEINKAASYMAGNLNEAGYLTMSAAEISQRLNLSAAAVSAALCELQALDPAGVGAADLRECLLLQLRREPHAPDEAAWIIERHLDDLAQGKLTRIAASLQVSMETVKAAVANIRGLDPRPGAQYAPSRNTYVIPDAIISREDGKYMIRFPRDILPKVGIHQEYQGIAEGTECQPTSSYIRDHARTAVWIIRSVEHRVHTLYRVLEAIFIEQVGFLEQGISALKPLNLRTISQSLGLHESTVSRAVQNKFVQTPWGVFELKYFFSSAVQTSEGDMASSTTIKTKIRQMIDQENKVKPYSDQNIVDQLEREGIQLSRRTVTKYREEMRILSSVLRKNLYG